MIFCNTQNTYIVLKRDHNMKAKRWIPADIKYMFHSSATVFNFFKCLQQPKHTSKSWTESRTHHCAGTPYYQPPSSTLRRWHQKEHEDSPHIWASWLDLQETKMQGEEKDRERKRDGVTKTASDETNAKDERNRQRERVLAGLTCSRWDYTWEAAVS